MALARTRGRPLVVVPEADAVRTLPAHPDGPVALDVPDDHVLVVAGLPGAGKSTLLRRVAGPRDVVLDPETISHRIAGRLPWMPYRLYRPVVHVLHRTRVLRAIATGVPDLVVHEPGARPAWRRLLTTVARRHGRPVHLLVVHATPDEAGDGRAVRGRGLPARRAAHHERVWAELAGELSRGWTGSQFAAEGFSGATVLPRSAISSVTSLRGPLA